jgi:hypothetical protein
VAHIITKAEVRADPLIHLPNFLWKAWQTIGLPKPTPLQYDFCEYLDNGAIGLDPNIPGDRKILMAFRGASKSYVTTAFGVCKLRRDRTERLLITSATSGFAKGVSNFAWQMVSNFDWLADMKPAPDQRRSAQAFDVAGCPPAVKDESFAAEGIFGQITGRRASTIIGDDLETPNTSETEGARANLRHRMGEFGAIILPGGSIYLLGTAQTEDTVYREYAEERGYELRIYPILYPVPSIDPKKDELVKYGPRLAPSLRKALEENPELAGTSTEPSRFTETDILSRKKEWGNTEFDRQFKMFLDAGMGKGNPLKLRDLVVMEIPTPKPSDPHLLLPSEIVYQPMPANRWEMDVDSLTGDSHLYGPAHADIWVPAEEIICYVDPSGEGEDETTWTIGAGLLGRVFALFQGASKDGHSSFVLKQIAADCKRWGVKTVRVESNFGQGMFGELLQPHFADIGGMVSIEEERQGATMKERRIVQTLEPLVTDHRLVVNASLLRNDFIVDYPTMEAAKRRYHRLTYQMTRISATRGAVRFDDRVDGLSGLAKHFIGVLTRQLQQAKEDGKLKAVEVEATRIIELRKAQGLPLFGLDKDPHTLGRPTSRSSSPLVGTRRKK